MSWRRGFAVLASAAAFAAAFPPYDLGWLAWIALVPLVLAARGAAPRVAFSLGYLWGLVAFGAVLWWLVAFGAGVWALLACMLALVPGAVLGVAAWADRGRPFDVLWLPVLWTASEFLRSQGPLGFPWALLGESQHASLAVAQIASLAGVFGLSFLVILANAVLARLLVGRASPAAVLATAAVLALSWAWGNAALGAPTAPPGPSRPLLAAVVQTTFATRPGQTATDAPARLSALERLTRQAARAGARIVVWPETASPVDIAGNPAVANQIGAWARAGRITLVASSLEGGLTDSAFVFSPDGLLGGRYDKTRLVPFVEFGERPGADPAVLPSLEGPIGIAICYESIFPDQARNSVRRGAALLAVLTNDQWFAGPAVASQHAAIGPLRAIEEGRYLLRASNDGGSAIIDPHGRVLARLGSGEAGVAVAPVAAATGLTLYARTGDVVGLAALLAAVVLLVPRSAREFRGPARASLAHVGAVSFVPLAVLAAARWIVHALIPGSAAPLPLPVVAALASVVALGRGRPPDRIGLQLKGFAPAAAAALAVIAAMYWLAVQGYVSHGVAVALVPPRGGWWLGTAVAVLIVGVTFEWWLRGLVFEAAAASGNWRTAVGWSTALGVAAALPLGAEAMVWSLCVGVAFGCIRARWAQVPALALAHGVGVSLLGFVLSGW